MKSLTAVLILALPLWALAAQRVTFQSAREDVQVTVIAGSTDETVLRFDVNAFTRDEISIDGRRFAVLHCGNEALSLMAGAPALPHVNRSVVIPDAEDVEIRVVASEYQDFVATRVAPSKGNLLRTVDPATVPYTFGPVYSQDNFYPADLATLSEPYILRDVRGAVVELHPFRVNPALGVLRVYTSVTLAVSATGPATVNVLNRVQFPQKVDPQFQQIYERRFLNYSQSRPERYVPVMEDGEMLIITADSFRTAMVPFRNWKQQKGIKTTLVNVSTIGNTATAIRNYIQNFYTTTAGNLAYVLLVGDAAQIATPSASGGAADPIYAKVAGFDNYPDIFVGRFSATSVAHVQTQVKRSVEYERDALASATWYRQGTCIGSNEGPGHNGEYDYEHEALIRTDLLAFTYQTVDAIYDPGATASQVTTALNAGRSIVNYTGHGAETQWVTTGFSNTNVNALTNDNHLPFIISVACVNGDFNGITCFAEAWLRATHAGQPTGAVAAYMSSINQSWDPPMDAQDEACDVLRLGSKTTVGGICFNGSCKMIDIYGNDGADMFDTWHIFGDPSLQVRTNTPAVMTVNHTVDILPGETQFAVTVFGVAGALCALSRDSLLYSAAYTNASGQATLSLPGTLPMDSTLKLTVTAFNKVTYVADILVSSGVDTQPPLIHLTPLPDTADETGPYTVTATITDHSGVAQALFRYGFNGADFVTRPMTRGADSVWTVTFGGYAAGTTVYYSISATDAASPSNTRTTAIYNFGVASTLYADDMEAGPDGWSSSALGVDWVNQWHLSSAQSHGGSHAWKFGGATGGYANHAYGGLASPAVALPVTTGASLSFWHWMQAETTTVGLDSALDGGVVDIALDGDVWQPLAAFSPAYNKLTRSISSGPFAPRTACFSGTIPWTQESVSLDAYAGHTVRFRFRFGSDNAGTRGGWLIDDVAIIARLDEPLVPTPVIGLRITTVPGGIRLLWPANGGSWYRVYSAATPDGPFTTLEAVVHSTSVDLPAADERRFYLITASTTD